MQRGSTRQPSEPWSRRGTSPERIVPESLTLFLSEFVHGHILYCAPCPPQHPVKPTNRWVAGQKPLLLTPGRAPSLCAGCRLARLRHRKKLGRLHHAEPNWRRDDHTKSNHHARARDGCEPELDVTQLHEVLDRVAFGNVPRDRRKIDCADDGQTLIASLRGHPIKPLEDELK